MILKPLENKIQSKKEESLKTVRIAKKRPKQLNALKLAKPKDVPKAVKNTVKN
jgi:hypothetical protein